MTNLDIYLFLLIATVTALIIAYSTIKKIRSINSNIIFNNLDQIQSFAVLVNNNDKIHHITSATCSLLGLEKSAVTNKDIGVLFNEEDHSRIKMALKNSDINNMEVIESVSIGYGSTAKHVLCKIIKTTSLTNNRDKLIIIHDRTSIINSIKQIEKNKQEVKNLSMVFESSFEDSFLPSLIINTEGTIKYYNKNFSLLINGQPVINNSTNISELIGHNIETMLKNIKKDKCFEVNCIISKKPRDLVFNIHKIKKKDNETYLLCQIQNITKLKHSEKVRKDLDVQLIKAKKVEYLGELSGIISHDLNNNLMPIITFSDSLVKNLPKEFIKEIDQAQKISDAGNHAKNILSKISEISYIDYTDNTLLNPSTLILDEISKLDVKDNIIISTNINENLKVKANSDVFTKAFNNLIENALEATKGVEQPHISVSFNEKTAPVTLKSCNKNIFIKNRTYNVLEIKNKDSYIEKDNMDKIFNPFYTTKHGDKKLGTGLTYVHHFAEKTESPMLVKSSKNNGVSFQIYMLQP